MSNKPRTSKDFFELIEKSKREIKESLNIVINEHLSPRLKEMDMPLIDGEYMLSAFVEDEQVEFYLELADGAWKSTDCNHSACSLLSLLENKESFSIAPVT